MNKVFTALIDVRSNTSVSSLNYHAFARDGGIDEIECHDELITKIIHRPDSPSSRYILR